MANIPKTHHLYEIIIAACLGVEMVPKPDQKQHNMQPLKYLNPIPAIHVFLSSLVCYVLRQANFYCKQYATRLDCSQGAV